MSKIKGRVNTFLFRLNGRECITFEVAPHPDPPVGRGNSELGWVSGMSARAFLRGEDGSPLD